MKRILLFAVMLCVAGQAWGGCFPSFPTFGRWQEGCGQEWWNDSSLTFYAPFDNPADPLRLIKGTGTLSFTRATTATYTPAGSTTMATAASGQLRIESNGALIEGQRTNLALYSEQLGLAATWVPSNMTVDNNTVVAPDGATTAETLTATADNATLLQSYTGTVAAYTGSYYLKRKTGTGAVQVSADNTTWTTCTINASTWTRCSDTRTVTVATYYHGIRLATNTDAVYAWGGGMELATFPSSYIPTTTAAVTRNQDVLATSVAIGNIDNNAGTAVALLNFTYRAVGAGYAAYWLGPTVDGNYRLTPQNNGTSFRVVYGDGITTKSATAPIVDVLAFTPYKHGFSWDANKVSTAFNGGTVYTNSTDKPIITLTATIRIGSRQADMPIYGNIKGLRIWNRAFTDAELQTITTP